MYNIIRRLVIDGNLISVGFINSHPTFVIQSCKKHGGKYFPKYLYLFVIIAIKLEMKSWVNATLQNIKFKI